MALVQTRQANDLDDSDPRAPAVEAYVSRSCVEQFDRQCPDTVEHHAPRCVKRCSQFRSAQAVS